MTSLRRTVRELLAGKRFDEALAWADRDRTLVRTLVSLLYDPEELLRWRAVGALGRLAARRPDLAKPLVTRLLWSLNDESGGIGWTSAPALGEIGRHAPALLRHAIRPLVHWMDDPGLLPGVLWAVGRVAAAYPQEAREMVPQIIPLLQGEPRVRGLAAWALGRIGDPRAAGPLGALAGDRAAVSVYEGDDLVTREVGELATEARSRIAAGPEGTH